MEELEKKDLETLVFEFCLTASKAQIELLYLLVWAEQYRRWANKVSYARPGSCSGSAWLVNLLQRDQTRAAPDKEQTMMIYYTSLDLWLKEEDCYYCGAVIPVDMFRVYIAGVENTGRGGFARCIGFPCCGACYDKKTVGERS